MDARCPVGHTVLRRGRWRLKYTNKEGKSVCVCGGGGGESDSCNRTFQQDDVNRLKKTVLYELALLCPFVCFLIAKKKNVL